MSVIAIPEEILELRASLRQFIDREVRPLEEQHVREINESGTYEGMPQDKLRLRKRSAELGFWTLHMPEDLGGGGLGYLGQVLLHEEACRHGLVLAQFESIFPVVTGPDARSTSTARLQQREKYLDPLMRAEKVTCFALTEPEAGSDATRIRTRAERAEGGWILNGRKHFITGGEHADFALVFAVTDAGEAGPGRHHRVLRGRATRPASR